MALEFPNMTPEGKRYFRELKKLAELEIRVGFQSGADPYEDGTDLVDVVAYNELGSSDIPARPFMKQSFENHEDELKNGCDLVNRTLAAGGTAEQALDKLGVIVKGLVQEEIVDGDFTPNAEATVKKKGSAQPLIDTGHMRQSVNYVIKRRGEG